MKKSSSVISLFSPFASSTASAPGVSDFFSTFCRSANASEEITYLKLCKSKFNYPRHQGNSSHTYRLISRSKLCRSLEQHLSYHLKTYLQFLLRNFVQIFINHSFFRKTSLPWVRVVSDKIKKKKIFLISTKWLVEDSWMICDDRRVLLERVKSSCVILPTIGSWE